MPKKRGQPRSRIANESVGGPIHRAPTVQAEIAPAKVSSRQSRTVSLIIGDIIAFLAFAAIGLVNHSKADGLALIPDVIATALPFAVGWFLVAPFLGAFRPNLLAQPREMAKRTLLAWIVAWPIGLLLRWGLPGQGYASFASFASFSVVVLIANAIFLEVWRWPFALTNSMQNVQPPPRSRRRKR